MHTRFRASDSYPELDDATVDLALDGGGATLVAAGHLGARSAGVVRTMLDALDAVPSEIHVRTADVHDVSDEFVAVLFEADIRRGELDLPGIVLDGPGQVLREAVQEWAQAGARASAHERVQRW